MVLCSCGRPEANKIVVKSDREIPMQEFIIAVMDRFGYLGICFLITVENLFPPIPSEIILPFGGFMTTYTNMSVRGVVLFSTVGSTVGAVILYRIGMLFSKRRLEALLETRACRLLGFQKEKVLRTLVWFEEKGKKAVLFGRCVPIIRSLISIPAGMAKMEFIPFFVYTVIGSTVWNFLLVSLGAALGASWIKVRVWLSVYSGVTKVLLWGGLIVLLLWIFMGRKGRNYKKKK